jgi:hypothetical protein
MPRGQVKLDELPASVQKQIKSQLPRKVVAQSEGKKSWSKAEVRSASLKVMAVIADYTQDQRRQILEHSLKVNRV